MSGQKYLIWSEEHAAWWLPNASGYTRWLREAGRYTLETAQEICAEANAHCEGGQWHEVYLPEPPLTALGKP